ncbi:thiol reductant ABC exporter subunit CydD [Bacillus carboniphilus]|uniref:Thiol reductant ABC exporter subunit CydD n=1 Tax=Bacillus carboniphilus TaxID=86663 RepID=A0ABY9JSL3_9BACI|nr:thiol reductant ABC exporter subunit CydD [Bacillus carboniphilus]WLR41804.1 thiol reductant ABC exporter subunit CydD [Bacillus carboniphilus]
MDELKAIAKQYRGTKFLLTIMAIMTGLVVVGQAYYIVSIVDAVFLKGKTIVDVSLQLWILLGLFVARALLTFVSGRVGVKMATKVKIDLREKLVHQYANSPLQTFIQGQSGEKVGVMLDAVDEVDSYFSRYIPQVNQTMMVSLIVVVAVFFAHVPSGLIMLVTAPFIPLFMALIGMKTKEKSEEQVNQLTAFSGRFLDQLQGLVTLKLYGRSHQHKQRLKKQSNDFRDQTMEVLKTAFLSSLTLEFISMLSIGIIALELGLRLVVFDSISFFTAFFILILAPEFYVSLKDLGSAFHTGRQSLGASKKIMEELNKSVQSVAWGEEKLPQQKEPPTIDIHEAEFSYGEEGFTLRKINLHFSPYETVAIVGPSGSGKSTLLHMIAGLIEPHHGRLEVAGNSLYSYKEQDWFEQISYISQEPFLFSGSLAENIAIGRPNSSSEDIRVAAQQSGLTDLIESLEDGLDTQIGEGGQALSGGEKQRVALARAFLKKPSIILFDEPTVGLDLRTERILQESIKELSEKSTVITVAHRLHTIKDADKIVFLKEGTLIATGDHDELLEKVKDYQEMVRIQQGVMEQ